MHYNSILCPVLPFIIWMIVKSGALPVLLMWLDQAVGSAGVKCTRHHKVEIWSPPSLSGSPSTCEPTDPDETGNWRV